MSKNIFISYSRREVGFIDQLVHDLEKQKHEVWLDYRNMIPGTPWLDQIYNGIKNADVILLVVSKASLGSQNVEVEWRRVLEQDKRIILLIFEAVDLPPELEAYEWVDFRGSYKAGVMELCSQLENQIQEEHPVPQTGFKVPFIVWFAAGLSLLTAFFSLYAFWTLLIPLLLIPLPYRIFKRDFNFTQVQSALLILPVALFVSASSVSDETELDNLANLFLLSLPVIAMMIFALRSSGMQRWGKEQATRPTFSNPLKAESASSKSVSFFIDHATEDHKIADELEKVLTKHGHKQADSIKDAETVFVVLSRFKSDTEADPEHKMVYPLVIQTGDVSQKLSRIQWIDLRPGVRRLDVIAKLLSEPAKLLKALGNRPRGNQLILPAPIMAMYYFLILLGTFVLGSFIRMITGLYNSQISDDTYFSATDTVIIPYVIIILITALFIFFMVRALLSRQGRLASFWGFTVTIFVLGVLLALQFVLGGLVMEMIYSFDASGDTSAVNVIVFPAATYLIGGMIMLGFLLFRGKDIMLWFPAKRSGTTR